MMNLATKTTGRMRGARRTLFSLAMVFTLGSAASAAADERRGIIGIQESCECAADQAGACLDDPSTVDKCAAACLTWGDTVSDRLDEALGGSRTFREVELLGGMVVAMILVLIALHILARQRRIGVGETVGAMVVPLVLVIIAGVFVSRLDNRAIKTVGEVGREVNALNVHLQSVRSSERLVGCKDALRQFVDPSTRRARVENVRASDHVLEALSSPTIDSPMGPAALPTVEDQRWSALLGGHLSLHDRIQAHTSLPNQEGKGWLRDHPVMRSLHVQKMRAFGLLPVASEAQPLHHWSIRLVFLAVLPLLLALGGLALWSRRWRNTDH